MISCAARAPLCNAPARRLRLRLQCPSLRRRRTMCHSRVWRGSPRRAVVSHSDITVGPHEKGSRSQLWTKPASGSAAPGGSKSPNMERTLSNAVCMSAASVCLQSAVAGGPPTHAFRIGERSGAAVQNVGKVSTSRRTRRHESGRLRWFPERSAESQGHFQHRARHDAGNGRPLFLQRRIEANGARGMFRELQHTDGHGHQAREACALKGWPANSLDLHAALLPAHGFHHCLKLHATLSRCKPRPVLVEPG